MGDEAIGFAAKAIYFPLFGLALLIPANKYVSSKQRRILIGTALFVCAIMILSFLTPYFSSVVNNISDARGGSEVSTAGQTTGVLANLVGTIAVISNFVFGSMLTPATVWLPTPVKAMYRAKATRWQVARTRNRVQTIPQRLSFILLSFAIGFAAKAIYFP